MSLYIIYYLHIINSRGFFCLASSPEIVRLALYQESVIWFLFPVIYYMLIFAYFTCFFIWVTNFIESVMMTLQVFYFTNFINETSKNVQASINLIFFFYYYKTCFVFLEKTFIRLCVYETYFIQLRYHDV